MADSEKKKKSESKIGNDCDRVLKERENNNNNNNNKNTKKAIKI